MACWRALAMAQSSAVKVCVGSAMGAGVGVGRGVAGGSAVPHPARAITSTASRGRGVTSASAI